MNIKDRATLEAARHYHIDPPELIWERTRRQPIAMARQLCQWLLFELGAKHLAGDRSTVEHSAKTVGDMRDSYPRFRADTDAMRERIRVECGVSGEPPPPKNKGGRRPYPRVPIREDSAITQAVMSGVCGFYRVDPAELRGREATARLREPRAVACLMLEAAGHRRLHIAEYFGRSKACVANITMRHKAKIVTDAEVRTRMEMCSALVASIVRGQVVS